MDRLDRIFELHRILKVSRYPVPRPLLAEKLECSDSTLYHVRHRLEALGAPVETDEETGGWYYARDEIDNFELPGLWFNASELYALLTADRLLSHVQPGVFDEEIGPLRERLQVLLAHRHAGSGELARRVRILGMGDRTVDPDVFRVLAEALVQRRRIDFEYHSRSNDTFTERTVSPQRLTRYRDNWYLDGWCHHRDALRSFSLDRIAHPRANGEAARDVEEAHLDHHFASAYGNFAGEPDDVAVVRFTKKRARWISEEAWHPEQQGHWLDDGRYELRIPYGNPAELILDILRYGDEVEVVSPEPLRRAVAKKLENAAALYRPQQEKSR